MDHTEPSQEASKSARGCRCQESLFDHVHQHCGQQHGGDDLTLFQGEGAGGPDISPRQGLHEILTKGVLNRACTTGA